MEIYVLDKNIKLYEDKYRNYNNELQLSIQISITEYKYYFYIFKHRCIITMYYNNFN